MTAFSLPVGPLGIPLLGFGTGTYYYKRGDEDFNQKLVDILVKAVRDGFVHIDTAESYGVYPEVAAALKQLSDVDRSTLFITDKFDSGSPSTGGKSKDGTPYEHLKKALKELGTDYVDLYLIHSPFITKEKFGFTLEEAWQSVEKTLDEGLAKRVGVSNFAVADVEKILKIAKVKPQVNQIEFNAFLQNQTPGIFEFSKKNGIVLEAYAPLAPLTKVDNSKGVPKEFDEVLDKLASKYGKTKTQLLLRWVIQVGVIPISTTSKDSRLEEWKGIFNFKLSQAEVDQLTEIGEKHKPQFRLYWGPEYSKYN
ncbi:DEKNAAC102548 [Brettanomyces naardenensis]|uniref:DEKNAAC102548 n=1 Tax=Brettanomyces naardenensis TaxID=13370 RepID=A0A448YK55_BRENA|nr:DEKNAAC102548 [Brettanomyces naardenensis]